MTLWADFRIRHLTSQMAEIRPKKQRRSGLQAAVACQEPAVSCHASKEKTDLIATLLSDADPRKRQHTGANILKNTMAPEFACSYRMALNQVLGSPCAPKPAMPDFLLIANEASVQLMNQAVQICGKCREQEVLKLLAAGSAISARMYPEALRMLFDLIDQRKDLRDVYESIQRTYALNQRGKGEVSLGSPR